MMAQAEKNEAQLGLAGNETSLRKHILTDELGLFMLDYESIPVPGNATIDLIGFHAMHQLNDWLYAGVGVYAPLLQGNYGGFMAGGVTVLARKNLFGNYFADAGASAGGGGGGNSVEHSKVLSGTGGYLKSFVGLGYDFEGFSAGVNIARFRFLGSAIDHSQFNIFMLVPFSYATAPYALSGLELPASEVNLFNGLRESMLMLGLDNMMQIQPTGSNKGTIHTIDLQYSYFLNEKMYWLIEAGVGYRGLPVYNQILGGVGYRYALSPRVNLYSQLALGSGGYSPDIIDTGSGLLVYPKLSAEYALNDDTGIVFSGGYMLAPGGSSRNFTLGASLNYHSRYGEVIHHASTARDVEFNGYRINVYQQTEYLKNMANRYHRRVNMISVQLDTIINDHLFVPSQGSIAYNDYYEYPGYGELLAGLGVQSKHSTDNRFQVFAQLLAGANVHGEIVKAEAGINYGLSDRFAIYANIGTTFSPRKSGLSGKKTQFKADSIGLGMTYRFSAPSQ